jgi:alpha-D-xyloside xylohydrolase
MIPNLPWRQFHYEENLRGELLPESERIALTLACKKALEFRMSLIPYLYSAFWKYKTTGTPVFRALVMDYPNDIYAQEVEDQVLIGDSLMAAPMFADECNKRNIYLPEGVWFVFETGARLIGGQWLNDVEVPIDHIPIFVKGNSIIPIANPVEWINENTQFNLTIKIYGSDISSFALYEDDGYSFNFEKGMYNITELQYKNNRLNLDAGFSSPMKKYIIDQIILKGE